jgi:membrane protein DedA with SNARE-associated domain/rhodanese-related sulfurtransferase
MDDIHLLITQYGLLLVFANVLIGQFGAPIPAFPTLMVAGGLARSGDLSLAMVFALAMLACVIADGVRFEVGRRFGHRVLKAVCKASLAPDSCVRQSEMTFEKWGVGALVVAKFVPGLNIVGPALAGAVRLGWARFTFYNGIGAALYSGAGISAGLLLHEQIDWLIGSIAEMSGYASVAIVMLLIVFIAYRWWQRQRFSKALRMARISVHELEQLVSDGQAPVILDVRSHSARLADARQIPGAVAVDLNNPDFKMTAARADSEIVVYCACPNEASAAKVARLLMERGFIRVRPLAGGLDAWAEAGLPIAPIGVTGGGSTGVSELPLLGGVGMAKMVQPFRRRA